MDMLLEKGGLLDELPAQRVTMSIHRKRQAAASRQFNNRGVPMTDKTAMVHWEGRGKKGVGKISTDAELNLRTFGSAFEYEPPAAPAGGAVIPGNRPHASRCVFLASDPPLCHVTR